MPCPARLSHSRAPTQTSHQLATTVPPSPYAQPRCLQPHDPRHARPARPSRTPYQHRRHCSSVADDFDSDDFESAGFDARLSLFTIAAAISPLSTRWSLVPPDHANEEAGDDEENDDEDSNDEDDEAGDDSTESDNELDTTKKTRAHDRSAPRTSTQIPLSLLFNPQSPRNTIALAEPAGAMSQRLSMMSTTSTLSTPSTASTTTALRRFWSPSSALSAPSSPPLSSSATMTPGLATSSTAPSTAPSTTAASMPLSALVGAPIPCAIGSNKSSNSTAPIRRNSGDVVMYIPPLVDATGGTLPRWQRRLLATSTPPSAEPSEAAAPIDDRFAAASPHRLLSADLLCLAHSAPTLFGLVWTRAVWPLLRLLLAPNRPAGGFWGGGGGGGGIATASVPLHLLALSFDEVVDAGETALQLGLALFGVCLLLTMPVLFLCLPGAFFLAYLGLGIAAVRIASWPLNNNSNSSVKVPIAPWSIDSGEAGTPVKDVDESWFFVSGMGATTRSLAKTGPRLAAVFGRPITIVRPGHTYGMAADMAYAALQRLLLPFCELPAPGVDALYSGVRGALMARQTTHHSGRVQQRRGRRVVVLAHNTGAIVVSQALARLQADVPATRLAQLEIYTFGSLAPDFVLPTGRVQLDADDRPHVEHVAHVRDPCARFGVLRSVREDLVGRYCGGIFVLGGEKRAATGNLAMLRPVRCVSRRDSSPMFRDIGTAPARATQRNGTAVIDSKSRGASASGGGSNSKNRHLSFPLSTNQQHKIQRSPANDITSAKNTKRRSTGFTSSLASSNRRDSNGSTSSTESTEHQQATSSIWSLSSALAVGRQYTSQRSTISMEDYLTALFGPEPWSMRPDIDGRCLSLDAYFAAATIAVDRELAEKREMAAMAQNIARNHDQGSEGGANCASSEDRLAKPKMAASRLSWTGLGATAAYATRKDSVTGAAGAEKRLAEDDGLLGLEATRRCCCECDGQSGRDVSRLVGYFSEAVVWHRERFGF